MQRRLQSALGEQLMGGIEPGAQRILPGLPVLGAIRVEGNDEGLLDVPHREAEPLADPLGPRVAVHEEGEALVVVDVLLLAAEDEAEDQRP